MGGRPVHCGLAGPCRPTVLSSAASLFALDVTISFACHLSVWEPAEDRKSHKVGDKPQVNGIAATTSGGAIRKQARSCGGQLDLDRTEG